MQNFGQDISGGASALRGAAPALARAAEQWRRADWLALAESDLESIADEPDRARIALLAGCALGQMGEYARARTAIRQALDWGCPPRTAARYLVAGVHNMLGRIATLRRDEAARQRHFEAAVAGDEDGDLALAGHDRAIREMANLGLFPDAAAVINKELWRLKAKPDSRQQEAKMTILRTELALLNEELSVALKRRQLFRSDSDDARHDASPAAGGGLHRQSTSQLGQDLWVLERTNYKRGGYFVEFGATDGVALSNTLLLETAYAWDGLLAEPNPKFLAELGRNRNVAISDACIGPVTGEEVEFILADVFGGMAQHAAEDKHADRRRAYRDAGHSLRLQTISLHDFLTENGAPRTIDYISVDTEGSEYEILRPFPFGEWDVRCWTIEHNFSPIRDKIFDLMQSHGYARVEAQWDDWYYKP